MPVKKNSSDEIKYEPIGSTICLPAGHQNCYVEPPWQCYLGRGKLFMPIYIIAVDQH